MTTIAQIQSAVAAAFKIPVAKMTEEIARGKGKDGRNGHEFSRPRQYAMYLASELTAHSLKRIGFYFGHRDHSTVIFGISAAEKRISADPEIAAKIVAIRNSLPRTKTVENPPPAIVERASVDA